MGLQVAGGVKNFSVGICDGAPSTECSSCFLAVVGLLVLCVSSWWFYGLVYAHISLWKELVALFCVPNCVLIVAWLSVFCVSSWCFHWLVCAHISLWKELAALFCVPDCVLAVMWLSVLCVSSRWCHGLVCAHMWTLVEELVILFCVPNCVLVVVWLSVLLVSSWWSMSKYLHTSPFGKSCLLCCVFLIVFLLTCGCQCSVFLP